MYIPLSFPMPVIIQIIKYKYIFPCIIHYAKSLVHTLLVFVIMWLYFETVRNKRLFLSNLSIPQPLFLSPSHGI